MYVYIYIFISGLSFTNIHDSQDSRERGRLSLYLYHFYALHRDLDIAGRLLQRAS